MMAEPMDLGLVTDFLSKHAGKHASEMANVDPEALKKAKDMYLTSHGRLPSRPSPQPLRPSSQLEAFTKEFSSSVKAFLERSRDREASAAFAASSWDGLQREAARARNWRRPFEVFDRAAEKVMTSCCIEFLLELMPYGEYSSALTGGLTLAYHAGASRVPQRDNVLLTRLRVQAASKKEKTREDILELFDSLSERGKQTKARIRLYSYDPDLRSSAEALYMAVLDCVRHSMAWLDARSAAESFKAFFQQSRYGSKLEDARENMKIKAKQFDDAVDLCLMRQVSDIRDGVEWLKFPANATFALAGFVKDFPTMAREVLLREAQENQARAGHFLQASHMQPQPAAAALARGFAALTRLFVVVHEGVQQQGIGLSTLSHLCGLMACTMRAPGMYTLAFFCGLHTAANARLQGGRGVMIALTLQLLRALGEVTFSSPLDPTTVLQRLAAGDLETICSVFSMALSYVPAGMVFVLIDGAHWNGTETRSAEMRAVRFDWSLAVQDLYMERQVFARGNSGAEELVIAGAASRRA
ncbi:hypothetical protein N658DRAFT_524689 [Parathielavia hyrcaniae]|uniref:Uncharacterized protein n=1 Tax=Parathielavia hyrcaniae TaxID=113614 RepID=A0AAN6T0S0_9PEZI|nr:hypothetical protein N658DRAFT_524689 [Parathielavia hyrcaniae]